MRMTYVSPTGAWKLKSDARTDVRCMQCAGGGARARGELSNGEGRAHDALTVTRAPRARGRVVALSTSTNRIVFTG